MSSGHEIREFAARQYSPHQDAEFVGAYPVGDEIKGLYSAERFGQEVSWVVSLPTNFPLLSKEIPEMPDTPERETNEQVLLVGGDETRWPRAHQLLLGAEKLTEKLKPGLGLEDSEVPLQPLAATTKKTGQAAKHIAVAAAEGAASMGDVVADPVKKIAVAAVATSVLGAGLALSAVEPVAAEQEPSVIEVPESHPIVFFYKPSAETSLQAVANDLNVSLELLESINPQFAENKVIGIDTPVQVKAPAGIVEQDEPVDPEIMAPRYGLTTDALKSANNLDKKGRVSGKINLPGRAAVKVDDRPVQIDALVAGLSLPPRTTAFMNRNAIPGTFVLPIIDELEPDVITKLAEVIDTPYIPPSSTSTSTTSTVLPKIEESVPIAQPEVSPQAVETAPPAPIETPVPIITEAPALTAEQGMEADKLMLIHGLITAIQTGDMGIVNHVVSFSPLFNPRNLPEELRHDKRIRYIPPANMLGIPGVIYEFSPDTPDLERTGISEVVSLLLVESFAFQLEKAASPMYLAAFPGACLRLGDVTADEGHDSHFGGQFDLTSAMECDIVNGHQTADGPIFWINKDGAMRINTSITNSKFNSSLNEKMMKRLRSLNIGGRPVIKSLLFNGPDPGNTADPFPNHSSHLHGNANSDIKDLKLKSFAKGGSRPEKNYDALRNSVILEYIAGQGVPGVSDTPVPAKVQYTAAPATPPAQPVSAASPADSPTPIMPVPFDSQEMTYLNIPAFYSPYLINSEHFSVADYMAQLKAESNFRANATSPVGASGPAQFMPGTWKELGRDGSDPDTKADPRNIEEALDAQRRYMENLYGLIEGLIASGKVKGDPKDLTWAAYNAGLGRVRQYRGMPRIKETQDYVKRIKGSSDEFNAKVLELVRNRLLRAAAQQTNE